MKDVWISMNFIGMEFPAGILVIIVLLRAGRRLTLLILYVICGSALLGTTLIPKYDFFTVWMPRSFAPKIIFIWHKKNSSFGHEKLLKDVGKIICWGRRTGIDFLAKDNISCPGQVWFCKKLFQFFKLQRLLLQWLATYGSKCHWSRK